MTLYNKNQALDAAALKEAMNKAAAQIKTLKTFDIKGEPVEAPAGKSQTLVTIQVKATGASRNYGQGTLNYLKGEAEGNGNEASEAIKKAWKKAAGNASTEDLIPWISQRQYKAILSGSGIDPDTIPASPATAKMVDLDALLKADPKRQEIEAMLKCRAETLVSRVVFIAKTNAAMASTNGYNLFKTKPISMFKTTKVETGDVLDAKGKKTGERQQENTFSIQDKKAAVDYMKKALIQNKAMLDLYTTTAEAIKREGGKEKIEEADTEYEETLPLYEGEVKAYEEEQAKAARAAARQDKKAEKDEELKASIVKSYELGATLEMIVMLTNVTTAKAEEIIKAAGWDPAKPYAEQAAAAANN